MTIAATLQEACAWIADAMLDGDGVDGDGAARFRGVVTDSRRTAAGNLYVALRGERFDGHDFVAAALAHGACAAVVERDWRPASEGVAGSTLLRCADTRVALGQLARAWRRRFDLPLVAVTGSNGKTTVKEMVAAIMRAAHGEAAHLATAGNLNNEIGVPLTLFELDARHRSAVIELGINQPGEMARLAAIAQPTVVLVNNAQREHQEFLDGVDASARENGAAIAALPADGVAVFPGDDACAPIWRELAGARRTIEFGLGGPGCAHAVHASPDARPSSFVLHLPDVVLEVRLKIEGVHNVRNALAAAACALAAGLPPQAIAAGLACFEPVPGRLRRIALEGGAHLIDDSYNANPDSVLAAIEVLAACDAPRILVLGDMGEVGEQGPQWHCEVGAQARHRGVDTMLALGPLSELAVRAFGRGATHCEDVDSLVGLLGARLREQPSATVLVKGSRFMRMERVIAGITSTSASDGTH